MDSRLRGPAEFLLSLRKCRDTRTFQEACDSFESGTKEIWKRGGGNLEARRRKFRIEVKEIWKRGGENLKTRRKKFGSEAKEIWKRGVINLQLIEWQLFYLLFKKSQFQSYEVTDRFAWT